MMYGSSFRKGEAVNVPGPLVTPKSTHAPVLDTLTVTSGVLTLVVVVVVESVKNRVDKGT